MIFSSEDENCFFMYFLPAYKTTFISRQDILYLKNETDLYLSLLKGMDGIVLSPSLCIASSFLVDKRSLATVCSLLVTFLLWDLIPCDKTDRRERLTWHLTTQSLLQLNCISWRNPKYTVLQKTCIFHNWQFPLFNTPTVWCSWLLCINSKENFYPIS